MAMSVKIVARRIGAVGKVSARRLCEEMTDFGAEKGMIV